MPEGPLIIRGLDDVVAAVPHLLGVCVQDCLVVFPTEPARAPIARLDMPTTQAELTAAAERVAAVYLGRSTPVVLLAYTQRRDLAEVAAARLSRALGPGCPVAAAASVNGQRWVRLDRPDHGTVGQDKRDLFAAESLYRDGAVPYGSQAEHRASFGPGADLIPPEVMAAATQAAVQAVGSVEGASVERAWVGVMLDRTAATGKRLSDVDAARLLADVQHTDFRDHAWAAMERQQAAQHAELWKGLLVRAPAGAEAPAACLAAFGYWVSGDGLSARAALDRIPPAQSYSMAELISTALRAGADPRCIPMPGELPKAIGSSTTSGHTLGVRQQRKQHPPPATGQDPPNVSR